MRKSMLISAILLILATFYVCFVKHLTISGSFRDLTLGELFTDDEKTQFLKLRRQGHMPDELVPKFHERFVRELENADYRAQQESRGLGITGKLWRAINTDAEVIRQNAFRNAFDGLWDRNRPVWRSLAADIGSLERSVAVDESGELAPLHKTIASEALGEYVKKHHVFTPAQFLWSSVRTVGEGVGDIATGQALDHGEHALEHFAKIGWILLAGCLVGKGLSAALARSTTWAATKLIIGRSLSQIEKSRSTTWAAAKPLKKIIPYLLIWGIAGIILGSFGKDKTLVVFIIILLIVNPILLPKIWRFVLARIGEIAKTIQGTD